MANSNAPFGLAPVQYLDGNAWNGQARLYTIALADTNAYAPGDPVATSSGNADIFGLSAVTLATAGTGNAVRGVAIAFGTNVSGSSATAGPYPGGPMIQAANLASVIVPATKTSIWYALVVDDPSVLFEIQENAGASAVTVVGKNANLVAGTNNGYVSGWMMNTAGVTTTSTLQLRIMQSIQRPDNTPASAYQRWLIRINNHELSGGVAGV